MANLDARDSKAEPFDSRSPQTTSVFYEKDHVFINKEKTRVKSILNTKQTSTADKIDIFCNDNWTNPEDLSKNKIIISFIPSLQHVLITVE